MLHRLARGVTAEGDALCAPALAIIDHLGACVPALEQLVALDAALNRELLTTDDVWRLTATAIPRRSWLAVQAEPRSQAPGETLARMELKAAGLAVEPQVLIPGVGHVDLVVEGRVVVEVDGLTYHSSPEAMEEDERRDRELALRGISRLRYPYSVVRRSRGLIARQVRALLMTASSPAA
ncbi:hypothetical protein [Demequina phytophila]|uniref:hypothetical protein n=1 Tax=Demequina phytophila TaxID=1638981 RepID=UPI00146FF707|nr:hypothetical protein [Demequina phytophila]